MTNTPPSTIADPQWLGPGVPLTPPPQLDNQILRPPYTIVEFTTMNLSRKNVRK